MELVLYLLLIHCSCVIHLCGRGRGAAPGAGGARAARPRAGASHFMSLRESWGKRMIITDL